MEQEEAPKGDNYDPLLGWWESGHGTIIYYRVRFNTPVFRRLSDVEQNVMTMLPNRQPETENDKMICAELIDKGYAVRSGDEIKPNMPCFTEKQLQELTDLLEPFMQELIQGAMDRVGLTEKVTLEHTPERITPYIKDMMNVPMYEEISDITRLLVEDSWLIPWTGMDATDIIVTK